MSDMTLRVLGVKKGRAFSEFRHIILQEGSSFAIHDGLREVFPGRFKVVKPAAVALHTIMDVLCDAPTTGVLTPETANAQAFLPDPASLRDSLSLADRGDDLHSMSRVQDAGGCFLIRAKAGMNPQVVEAFAQTGSGCARFVTSRFRPSRPSCPNVNGSNSGCSGRSTATPSACGWSSAGTCARKTFALF